MNDRMAEGAGREPVAHRLFHRADIRSEGSEDLFEGAIPAFNQCFGRAAAHRHGLDVAFLHENARLGG